MSTPNSSAKRSNTPMASSEKRISVSVGNWERMPPAALLVVPAPTRLALEHDDVALAAPGEVIGDAAADDAAADHDHARRSGQCS